MKKKRKIATNVFHKQFVFLLLIFFDFLLFHSSIAWRSEKSLRVFTARDKMRRKSKDLKLCVRKSKAHFRKLDTCLYKSGK